MIVLVSDARRCSTVARDSSHTILSSALQQDIDSRVPLFHFIALPDLEDIGVSVEYASLRSTHLKCIKRHRRYVHCPSPLYAQTISHLQHPRRSYNQSAMKSVFAVLALATCTLAQRLTILSPSPDDTLVSGQNFTAELQQEVCLTFSHTNPVFLTTVELARTRSAVSNKSPSPSP